MTSYESKEDLIHEEIKKKAFLSPLYVLTTNKEHDYTLWLETKQTNMIYCCVMCLKTGEQLLKVKYINESEFLYEMLMENDKILPLYITKYFGKESVHNYLLEYKEFGEYYKFNLNSCSHVKKILLLNCGESMFFENPFVTFDKNGNINYLNEPLDWNSYADGVIYENRVKNVVDFLSGQSVLNFMKIINSAY